jgi:sulfate transport system ATP-binding protein
LRRWLRRLHDEIHLTSVFVTPDQEEAIELADRVVIINRGIVEQNGSVEDVVERPANEFVMSFFGTVNVFRDPLRPERVVYARPHDVEICSAPGEGTVRARVDDARTVGAIVRLVALAGDGSTIHIEVTREEYQRVAAAKGQSVYLRPRTARAFDADFSRAER